MARWVDLPDWRDGTAARLHRALEHAVWQTDRMTEIWQRVGMSPAQVVWHHQTPSALWQMLTRDASDAGKLEALIREVRDEVPAAAAELDLVLAAQAPSANWYLCADRHRSMLVGPGGKRAVLDRTHLRASLVQMLKEEYPILAIVGKAGSGKTYSRHLIKHVLCDDPAMRCDFIVIDIEHDWYDTVTAGEFITKLATKMGIDGITDVDPLVEHSRAARELVHQFVGRYRSLPRQERWVFIDGLDRTSVDPAVLIAVTQLAKEVEAGQLRDLRLIVTGHPCDFSPDVLDILLLESLDEITEHDLRQFFGHVADVAGQPLSGDELAALVDEVLAEATLTDLHALGRKAGKLAHASFGPAGGAA
ncbi:hypothetical protein G7043_44680 [Lentzea sp. NEAU-D13]|uniref:Effector-associated domain-containing protein n=1 Tax=Lentzea alba TaxID=2714351 RepID=A0A7C9RY21_9PSEU|nr:hypothetical protein [Lentzea alba]NGY66005.1 hypothetical protein [Lentzea alba]